MRDKGSGHRLRDVAVTVGQQCLLAALYFAMGRLGLSLAYYHDNATLIWPPSGLALAALVLYSLRLWPGVFLGMLIVNATTGTSWLPALGIATGSTLEAVVGSLLLVRFADFRPSLERLQDAIWFLLIGALGCTLVGATIGTAVLWSSGAVEASQLSMVWLVWWLGDAAGAVIVAPLLFMLAYGTQPWRGLVRRAEFWLALILVVAVSIGTFGGFLSGPWARIASFAPFPFLVWAGSRLGSRGAVSVSFGILAIATVGTALGLGPFGQADPANSTLLLWGYGMSMGSIAFILAAVVGQRDASERRRLVEEAERQAAERNRVLLLERERITREMHDGLGGQLMSAIAMVERGQGSGAEVAEALRHALDDMRIVIDTLDPDTTELRVSLGKLRARLGPLLHRNGIRLEWEVSEDPRFDRIGAEQSLHLLRIIQEAVMNSLRHAEPSCVEVDVTARSGLQSCIAVEIRDDGRGASTDGGTGGRGVRNMQARAEALGGALRIDSDESGTRVGLLVPVPA